MTRLQDDVLDELESAGAAGGSTGWDAFSGYLPDSPDQAIALYVTAGQQPETAGTEDTRKYDYPSLQVQVRAAKLRGDVAYDKAREVFDQLHDATISGWIYLYANTQPFELGHDSNERPVWVINFSAMRERS